MTINGKDVLPDFMVPGWQVEIGRHTFTEEAIIRFARAFDPQTFHTDPAAAEQSFLGGLCASGWHTASVWMRKQRDYMGRHLPELARQGVPVPEFGPSPGFENLRWLRPVFAGETIVYFNSTTACRPSASRPGWHVITGRQWAETEDGKPVLEFESSVLVHLPGED